MRVRSVCRVLPVIALMLVVGCMSASRHQQELASTAERQMTLGTVQKEIRLGMSQADVATALGSPNIVTRDSSQKETWIYDKIATEVSYSRDSGGLGIVGILIGGTGSLGGGGGASGSYSKEAGASSSTQRTLTVVIRFDADGLVESTTYHASKF